MKSNAKIIHFNIGSLPRSFRDKLYQRIFEHDLALDVCRQAIVYEAAKEAERDHDTLASLYDRLDMLTTYRDAIASVLHPGAPPESTTNGPSQFALTIAEVLADIIQGLKKLGRILAEIGDRLGTKITKLLGSLQAHQGCANTPTRYAARSRITRVPARARHEVKDIPTRGETVYRRRCL